MDEQRIKKAMMEDEEIEIDLIGLVFDFFKILREYWGLFIGIVLIVTISLTSFQYLTYSPMYRCEAIFTVATGTEDKQSGVTSYNYYYSSSTADQLSKTFPYILESNYFKSVLLENLGTNYLNGTLSSQTVTDSNMVTMSVVSSQPQDALQILTTAIEIYPEVANFVLGDIQFHMINNAKLPTTPYNQITFLKTTGFSALIGSIVGIIILSMMALLRKTIKTQEQMSQISSLKYLASIPTVKYKARHKESSHYISILDHRTSYSFKEGLRSLQIRLDRLLQRQNHQVIIITSSVPGEGKSTISVNFAQTLAAHGKKVLLIDADLRKPSLGKRLDTFESKGIKDFLNDSEINMDKIDYIEKGQLYFIGNQEVESNPVAVLSDERLEGLFEKLKSLFDYIIIDTPPCGMFQDAQLIQDFADALIYVVKYDLIPSQKILEGLSLLKNGHCQMGYIFNLCSSFSNDYGYGRYGYGRYNYGYGNKKR